MIVLNIEKTLSMLKTENDSFSVLKLKESKNRYLGILTDISNSVKSKQGQTLVVTTNENLNLSELKEEFRQLWKDNFDLINLKRIIFVPREFAYAYLSSEASEVLSKEYDEDDDINLDDPVVYELCSKDKHLLEYHKGKIRRYPLSKCSVKEIIGIIEGSYVISDKVAVLAGSELIKDFRQYKKYLKRPCLAVAGNKIVPDEDQVHLDILENCLYSLELIFKSKKLAKAIYVLSRKSIEAGLFRGEEDMSNESEIGALLEDGFDEPEEEEVFEEEVIDEPIEEPEESEELIEDTIEEYEEEPIEEIDEEPIEEEFIEEFVEEPEVELNEEPEEELIEEPEVVEDEGPKQKKSLKKIASLEEVVHEKKQLKKVAELEESPEVVEEPIDEPEEEIPVEPVEEVIQPVVPKKQLKKVLIVQEEQEETPEEEPALEIEEPVEEEVKEIPKAVKSEVTAQRIKEMDEIFNPSNELKNHKKVGTIDFVDSFDLPQAPKQIKKKKKPDTNSGTETGSSSDDDVPWQKNKETQEEVVPEEPTEVERPAKDTEAITNEELVAVVKSVDEFIKESNEEKVMEDAEVEESNEEASEEVTEVRESNEEASEEVTEAREPIFVDVKKRESAKETEPKKETKKEKKAKKAKSKVKGKSKAGKRILGAFLVLILSVATVFAADIIVTKSINTSSPIDDLNNALQQRETLSAELSDLEESHVIMRQEIDKIQNAEGAVPYDYNSLRELNVALNGLVDVKSVSASKGLIIVEFSLNRSKTLLDTMYIGLQINMNDDTLVEAVKTKLGLTVESYVNTTFDSDDLMFNDTSKSYTYIINTDEAVKG